VVVGVVVFGSEIFSRLGLVFWLGEGEDIWRVLGRETAVDARWSGVLGLLIFDFFLFGFCADFFFFFKGFFVSSSVVSSS